MGEQGGEPLSPFIERGSNMLVQSNLPGSNFHNEKKNYQLVGEETSLMEKANTTTFCVIQDLNNKQAWAELCQAQA